MVEHRSRRGFRDTLRVALALSVAATVAGCADQPQKREAELKQLVALVAGHYDTVAQARSESAQGGPQREPMQLAIAPVDALLIGNSVFYLQESVAADARRVITQQLLSFQVTQGTPLLVETPHALVEPLRWRDGDRNPELFRSMLQQDVRALAGCEVTWRKVPEGFDGSTDPARCRAPSRATGDSIRVEQKYQLRADGLTISERHLDATGAVVGEEPPLKFRRRVE